MDNHRYGSRLMKQISLLSTNMGKSYGLCGENKVKSRFGARNAQKRCFSINSLYIQYFLLDMIHFGFCLIIALRPFMICLHWRSRRKVMAQ